MKLLLSGLDTVDCAYYVCSGCISNLDFAALREKREAHRESNSRNALPVELGGVEFMPSPNGTKSGYPFVISNQHCSIQFGEFNDPKFFATYRSIALWHQGAHALHENFLRWATN